MKFVIPLLSICVLQSIFVYGQTTAGYKYTYEVQIQINNGDNKIRIDTQANKANINTVKGKISNKKSEPLKVMTIRLKSSDTTLVATSDKNGFFSFTAKPSVYKLLVTGIGYNLVQENIILTKAYNVFCSIYLEEEQSITRYKVYSKNQLSEHHIKSIKSCIQKNGQSIRKCNRKGAYFITQEI